MSSCAFRLLPRNLSSSSSIFSAVASIIPSCFLNSYRAEHEYGTRFPAHAKSAWNDLMIGLSVSRLFGIESSFLGWDFYLQASNCPDTLRNSILREKHKDYDGWPQNQGEMRMNTERAGMCDIRRWHHRPSPRAPQHPCARAPTSHPTHTHDISIRLCPTSFYPISRISSDVFSSLIDRNVSKISKIPISCQSHQPEGQSHQLDTKQSQWMQESIERDKQSSSAQMIVLVQQSNARRRD